MIVTIMQPTYLPWIGYFNLIKNSEYFIPQGWTLAEK